MKNPHKLLKIANDALMEIFEYFDCSCTWYAIEDNTNVYWNHNFNNIFWGDKDKPDYTYSEDIINLYEREDYTLATIYSSTGDKIALLFDNSKKYTWEEEE